jgi:hypothetical protein
VLASASTAHAYRQRAQDQRPHGARSFIEHALRRHDPECRRDNEPLTLKPEGRPSFIGGKFGCSTGLSHQPQRAPSAPDRTSLGPGGRWRYRGRCSGNDDQDERSQAPVLNAQNTANDIHSAGSAALLRRLIAKLAAIARILVAFADDAKEQTGAIDRLDFQGRGLADAQAAGIRAYFASSIVVGTTGRLSLLYRQHRRYIFPPRHEPTEDAMSKGKEKRKPKADKSQKKGAAPAQAGSVTNAFAKKPQKP